MKLEQFESIWCIDFEYKSDPGELPLIHCLVAKEVLTGALQRWTYPQLQETPQPPFPIGPRQLVVGYYLPAEFGCFLQLGWPRPTHSLDLCTEFKHLKNGIRDGLSRSLVGALTHHNLLPLIPVDKANWRGLAMRGGPFTAEEESGLLDYCQQDVEATAGLLRVMAPQLDPERALLRGRYSWAVAQMERTGIPIDIRLLGILGARWPDIKAGLIARVDRGQVYVDGSFSEERFNRFLAEEGIAWPRLESGRLALDDDTFRQQARAHPGSIAPLHELRSSLSKLRLNDLAVGRDGRNRTMLSPFASATGRNQPSNAKFIFGPSTWVRGLIKPEEGRALAYIDYCQQELGIAAALSGDRRLMEAYRSGDPYLTFAKMAHAVPQNATKKTHPEQRAAYKVCMLGVQYGMGAKSLAAQTGGSAIAAQTLLQAHRDAFPDYWSWSDRVQDTGFATGRLETRFGWQRRVTANDAPASVRNFPVQGNGAEMLRLALMKALDAGVSVIAPVHDAILIEAPLADIEEVVRITQEAMRWASEQVLNGFGLESEAKIIRFPDRYMDQERGLKFWNTVMGLIGEPEHPLY